MKQKFVVEFDIPEGMPKVEKSRLQTAAWGCGLSWDAFNNVKVTEVKRKKKKIVLMSCPFCGRQPKGKKVVK